MLVPLFGPVVNCYSNTLSLLPKVKACCMATFGNEELARASEELSSFASFMAPSLPTPASTPAPSQASTEMPVDQSSKRGTRARVRMWTGPSGVVAREREPGPREEFRALGRLVLRQEDSLAVM